MFIVSVGLNDKTAPVEVREKIVFPAPGLAGALQSLKARAGIEGCVILSTCNRSEIYVATTDAEKGLAQVKDFIRAYSGLSFKDMDDYFYVRTIYEAVRHLFKVAAGLDSMVLGETQILGQVREAYQAAFDCGVTNTVLNMFFQQALTVGKKVRTETEIDRHAVSISYAAVEAAKQQLGDLNGKNVLVVGAGEMSELTVRHMVSHGAVHVTVANRSFDRGEELAALFSGRAVPFAELDSCLRQADIVISATSAQEYIIRSCQVQEILASRGERRLFMVDIAVPRDVEPAVGRIPGVTLLDIDDLRHVVDRNLEERKQAAVKAAALIDQEIEEFFKYLGTRFMVPTIQAFKRKLEAIRDHEVEQALRHLGQLSDKEIKTVHCMANSMINHIMHDPVVNLKGYGVTNQGHLYAEIFQNLFNLKVEGQEGKGG
ncbi:glutamyl-tRNA reductase [Candidatus Formimonas warabiya]|uniref:Glutamyl-tRNA reductase n=1 Tax=Formimonas warabiya TaxID=1761012 RepID=A0A3G1KPV6_FORW1|nr:glutamyl-tRNA reductase [Candidatus Formimonas warabiya]ATW24470.1 glutamyl-tRNA reductase [Candidatus Formimonas warabiya]